MLTILRDTQERLDVACEWQVVNTQGQLDPQGEAVFVAQVEISPGVNLRTAFRNIIADILLRAPTAKYGYWERRDSTGDGVVIPHTFTRAQFTRYLHKWLEVMV